MYYHSVNNQNTENYLLGISSKAKKVWFKTLSIQAGKYSSTLYTGTITEKNILSICSLILRVILVENKVYISLRMQKRAV